MLSGISLDVKKCHDNNFSVNLFVEYFMVCVRVCVEMKKLKFTEVCDLVKGTMLVEPVPK